MPDATPTEVEDIGLSLYGVTMSVLTKHRFNTGEYYRMAETGVIKANARVELLDGEIIDMSPIGPFHGGVVNRLNSLFNATAKERYLVAVQNPLQLDDYNEPQPDLMLLRPVADDYTSKHASPEDVLLLVEVADTSLQYDRGDKLQAFARAGVSEVWIVNLQERMLEVYREPRPTGYRSITSFRPGDRVSPAAFPVIIVDIARLLRA
jgi:Uma2 family endonuclease